MYKAVSREATAAHRRMATERAAPGRGCCWMRRSRAGRRATTFRAAVGRHARGRRPGPRCAHRPWPVITSSDAHQANAAPGTIAETLQKHLVRERRVRLDVVDNALNKESSSGDLTSRWRRSTSSTPASVLLCAADRVLPTMTETSWLVIGRGARNARLRSRRVPDLGVYASTRAVIRVGRPGQSQESLSMSSLGRSMPRRAFALTKPTDRHLRRYASDVLLWRRTPACCARFGTSARISRNLRAWSAPRTRDRAACAPAHAPR